MPTGYYKRQPLWKRLLSRVKQGPGCWEWQGAIGTNGYGRIGFNNKVLQAHRVSWELFYFKLHSQDDWVLHKCDNRKCVRPDHLFLGDRMANIQDCVSKKRHPFGERSSLSKLTRDQIEKIRSLYSSGKYTQQQLGDRFGVSGTNIHHIVAGKSWRQEVI